MSKSISVARDFSPTPGSRYESEGDFSGEVFRRDCLLPAVREAIASHSTLTINLDGTAGYATSFLEEAFGGLVRVEGHKIEDLRKVLQFVSLEEDYLVDDIWLYIDEAQRR